MRFVQSALLLCLLAVSGHAQTSNLWRPQPNPTPPPCPQIRQFYNISGAFQQIDCNGVITSISSGSSLQDPGASGVVVRTTVNTTVARTLTGTANRIVITNGNGVSGPPTFDIGSTVATSGNNLGFFSSTTSAQLAGVVSDETGSGALVFGNTPSLTTPTIASFANAAHNHEGAAGGGQLNASNVFSAGAVTLARGGTGSSLSDPGAHRLLGWDDTDNQVRFFVVGSGLAYDAGTDTLSAAAGLGDTGANGIVARTALNTTVARTLQQPAAGITITNPGGVAGDPTFALANDLAAVEALSSAGFAVRATTDTWAVRTLQGTANRVAITNPTGASGDPTIDIGSDVVTLTGAQTLSNKTLTNPRIVTAISDSNGNSLFDLTATGSAVNRFGVTNATAGNAPTLASTGTDTNINIILAPKGTGGVSSSGNVTIAKDSPFTIFQDTVGGSGSDFVLNFNGGITNIGRNGQTDLLLSNSTGVYTFGQIPVLPASTPTTANQATRKQYVDDTTVAWSACFFDLDPSTSSTSTEDRASFIVPDGTTMAITKLRIKYSQGSHTSGATITYSVIVRNTVGGGAGIGNIVLDNTNNTINNVYTNDIGDQALSPGDSVTISMTRSGTITERSVSPCVIGTQKRIP